DRYGSAAPTHGGKAHRHMATVAYDAHTHHSDLSSQAYIVRSNSDLFSNYTYFENDPINGDQIEQKDDRTMVGSALGWAYHYQLGPAHMTASLGLQFRADAINNALYHDAAQVRLLTVTDDKLNERAIGLYAQEEMKLSRALRFILGARGDHLDVGSRDAARFSPKFVGVLSPIEQLDVFVDYGWGFHSNDARGVFAPPNRANLITPTVSYEAGLRIKPDPSFQLSLAGFVINSRGETVYREDTATNESVPATRRYGVEAQALYHGKSGFFADAAAALSKERYRNDPANADSMTPAPTKTVSAGAGFSRAFGSYTPFVAVRGKLVAEHPATPDQRLYAQGYGTLDADAGLRWWNLEARLDMQNILGAQWRQVSSAATTQLGYESSPVNGVVYSVGAPRTVMGSLRFYWQ
ncbi:MAG TPA: TonB-dependent receptor, partial [Polyangiaceae bacterium]|nr:TonB-dependent receptor [Polyangiaceae bacterium]